jgi:asparagine synthase (glutamine-hydrolysing)
MCGIAGILRVYPPGVAAPPHFESIPEAWLDLLDDSIKHRGPDGQGRFRDRAIRADGCTVDVALIHRRLSILDHTGGAQPMVSHSPSFQEGAGGSSSGATSSQAAPDATSTLPLLFQGPPTATVRYEPIAGNTNNLLAVTFNGCIYNHRELRRELEAKGHLFVTDHSDTEVLLHGWREWQEKIIDRLDGMYASALWDAKSARLFLMRDPAGEKPLHWHELPDGTITFSSSPNGLCRWASRNKASGRQTRPWGVLQALTFGYGHTSPIERSHFVRPGHVLEAGAHDPNQGHRPRHARLRLPRAEASDPHLAVDAVDRLLSSAVESRLESDVPLGCFLSGGVDSSLVAHYALQKSGSLQTFSMRMPSAGFDESAHAKHVASHLGTKHQTLDCEMSPAEDLLKLIESLGLPFGDSSLLPTFWICRAARSQVAVALSGDGGDELFCGYERYRAASWLPFLREYLPRFPTGFLANSNPKSRRERARRLLLAAWGGGYESLTRLFSQEESNELGLPMIDACTQCYEAGPFPWSGAQSNPNAYPIMFHTGDLDPPRMDFANYLPNDLMTKVDTAAMSVALEVRAPFLANEVVDVALAAPLSVLMPRGQRKGLLRAVARKYLPKEIVDRPKMGFAIPVGEWFRSDFGQMRTLLLDMLHSTDPFPADLLGLELNRRFIDQMLAEHMESRRDHSQRLYMLLVLAIWCRWLRRIRGDARGVSSSGS